MNKKKFIICVSIVLLLVVGFCIYKLWFAIPKGSKINVDGNAVHNEFNNLISGGQLCRLNDKLYFNYEKSDHKNGLIEISENGSKRIFQRKHPIIFPHYGTTNDPIFTGDNKLYRITFDDKFLECYDGNEFKNVIPLKEYDIFLKYKTYQIPGKYFCKNGEFFLIANDNRTDTFNLLVWTNNKFITPIQNIIDFYITEDGEIFYMSKLNEDDYAFLQYDRITRSSKKIIDFNAHIVDFIVENNFIVCRLVNNSHYEIAVVDLSNSNIEFMIIDRDFEGINPKRVTFGDLPDYILSPPKPNYRRNETVFSKYFVERTTEYTLNSLTSYNKNVYISTNEGLYKYNLYSQKKEKIIDGDIKSSYFVDDKYIYYVKSDETLWRMTYDKSINEKVYG